MAAVAMLTVKRIGGYISIHQVSHDDSYTIPRIYIRYFGCAGLSLPKPAMQVLPDEREPCNRIAILPSARIPAVYVNPGEHLKQASRARRTCQVSSHGREVLSAARDHAEEVEFCKNLEDGGRG